MRNKILALKKEFKPYYEVYLSQLPKHGFKTVRCKSIKTLAKYMAKKEYINFAYISFDVFVKDVLEKDELNQADLT